jgi:hypothetical protein
VVKLRRILRPAYKAYASQVCIALKTLMRMMERCSDNFGFIAPIIYITGKESVCAMCEEGG